MSDKTKDVKEVKDEKQAEPRATQNPMTIPWPTDPHGALSGLKTGGVAAVKRINGDPEKLKRFERGLRLLAQHARACFERDTKAREVAKENAKAAARRIEARDRRILQRQYDAAEAKLNSIGRQIDQSQVAEDARNEGTSE